MDLFQDMTEEWVHEDLRDNINGREIRNVLFSVIAFARANGRSLELKEFKIMRDSKRRFKEYLREQTILTKRRNE